LELCRHKGIAASMYYGCSKKSLKAGKRRLAGDRARAATSDEVKRDSVLKEIVAYLSLENWLLNNVWFSPSASVLWLINQHQGVHVRANARIVEEAGSQPAVLLH
jgi:hypothetical protein